MTDDLRERVTVILGGVLTPTGEAVRDSLVALIRAERAAVLIRAADSIDNAFAGVIDANQPGGQFRYSERFRITEWLRARAEEERRG